MLDQYHYRESKGKTQVVKCRICEKEMKLQNYEQHIKSKHPTENCKDHRSKSDKSIKSMFTAKRSCPDQNISVDEPPKKKVSTLAIDSNHNLAIADSALDDSSVNTSLATGSVDSIFPVASIDPDVEKTEIKAFEVKTLLEKLAPLSQLDESTISNFAKNIEEFSKLKLHSIASAEKDAETEPDITDINSESLLMSCKSLGDITSRFQEFEYNENLGGVVCTVCTCDKNPANTNVVFQYPSDLESDFIDKVMSQKFSNLKRSIKRHFERKTHQNCLALAANKANIQYKEDARNQAVALRVSRIAYFQLKRGRPDTDFTSLIYLHSVNGCDIGDINHSSRYPGKFLVHLSEVLEKELKHYLSSNLEQTGYKPPTKVVADKATWQHQTRQLIGVVTVVPGADQPLQALILATPVVKSHNSAGVAENITEVTDKFIKGDQFRGGSFDGQYFHLGVPKLLDNHYGVKAQYDVDPMHRAGTVDLHLRKMESSLWIVNLTSLVGQAFKVVNFGKNFEHFFEVCEDLVRLGYDISFKFPRFFSETKFANYVRLVYKSFQVDYPAIIRTFKELVATLNQGSSDDRR